MTILHPSAISGRVEALLVNPDARDESIETARVEALRAGFDGLAGDRHAGLVARADVRYRRQYAEGTPIRNTRQATLLSVEELAEVAAVMGIERILPEWLGGNVLISGIADLTLLPPSTRLLFASGAALVVDNENIACKYPAAVIEGHYPAPEVGFVRAARNKRGLVAWVEREGEIRVGDDVAVHLPPLRLYPHA